MKMRGVWVVLFVAMVSLLFFQSIWLHNSFQMSRMDIENVVDLILIKTVEKEVLIRYEASLANEELAFGSLEDADTTGVSRVFSKEEVMEGGIFQPILELVGNSFDINLLDSIFVQNLKDATLSIDYLLIYKDSTGHILEQAGDLPASKVDKAFRTDALLIVDGKRVQAVVDIVPAVVFRQMIWLLVASFLMLIVLVFCIVYQARTIVTQYKLNQLRDDFTHALTHDMKTPLSTINAALFQFRSGLLNDNPEMRERFGRVGMEQVAGLQMLVDRILTIAKLEQGKSLLERSDTDLQHIVEELKERYTLSKDKEVIIRTSFELENQVIYLDPTLIKNAIANLLENAVKYSGESVVVDIDCYIKDEQLFIRVQDNGFGISTNDQQKIFEKFERGAAVGRKGAKGFGLGLNYVRHVAEAHGGIVALYSAQGRGSEFTLVLPVINSI